MGRLDSGAAHGTQDQTRHARRTNAVAAWPQQAVFPRLVANRTLVISGIIRVCRRRLWSCRWSGIV